MNSELQKKLLSSAATLLLGFFAGGILIASTGNNPLAVYSVMFSGALGSTRGVADTFAFMAPMILTALAFLIPAKAGMWNVGAQGQMYFGGFIAGTIGLLIALPPGIHQLTAFAFAGGIGALWALLPALLREFRRASEIVTTIMLNFVAQAATSYFLYNTLSSVFGLPTGNGQTPYVKDSAILPLLVSYAPGTGASVMIVISVAIALVSSAFIASSKWGFAIRAVGQNPKVAETHGMDPVRFRILAMVLGGAIAGIAGAGDIIGRYNQYRDLFPEGYFGGEGFAGIAVALVARLNAVATIPAALLFGLMATGAPALQATFGGIPRELVWTLQGIIILFQAIPYVYEAVVKRTLKKRE